MILLAVRNPDVFHLSSMLEKPSPLGQFGIEPVNGATFIRPDLFEIAYRHGFGRRRAGLIAKAPDGIDIVVLSERLQKLRRISGHNIERTAGQIAGVKKLVKISRDQRIGLRWNRNHRVSHRQSRHHQRKKTEQRSLSWTDEAYRPDRLIHREGDIPKWRIVHRAIKLIGPRRIRENALDAEINFRVSLLCANHSGQTMRNFVAPLRKIFRAVVKNL